ncbi:hypothetical protein HQ544_04865 [Candidatus Falkowbacteria bacterium]|nr:hypothetical protein [Candidatus Falkowbacteria bacterium]
MLLVFGVVVTFAGVFIALSGNWMGLFPFLCGIAIIILTLVFALKKNTRADVVE